MTLDELRIRMILSVKVIDVSVATRYAYWCAWCSRQYFKHY